MRKITVLIFVVFSCFAFANPKSKGEESIMIDSFEIIVVDADTEEVIPAAQIRIDENVLQAYTDFDGIAEFKHLSQGTYDIEISFVSYQKKHLKSFELNSSSNKLVVKLQP